MKWTVCDVCYKEGKYTTAKYRTGIRSIKVDLCIAHKSHFDNMKADDFIKAALKLFESNEGGATRHE